MLQAAEVMDSDHYKTTVFGELLDRREIADEMIDEIVKLSADINSDHYATIILRKALDRPNLSDKALKT